MYVFMYTSILRQIHKSQCKYIITMLHLIIACKAYFVIPVAKSNSSLISL